MKKLLMTAAMVFGTISMAEAKTPTTQHETVNKYDKASITEETTSTRQVITPTADGNSQVTTTTEQSENRVGVNQNPNITIDGKPALDVKQKIDTLPAVTTTVTTTGQ